MKLRHFKRAAVAALASLTLLSSSRAAVVVGTGNDVSFLLIEAPDFGAPLQYEFHYTYNPSALIDTYAMMRAIDLADSSLAFDFINYGTAQAPNFFLDSITFNSISLANGDPFWAQWVSGGKAGFPAGTAVASGVWSEGSGLSSPYRTLAPGSWDGFIFNGTYNPDPPYELTSAPPSVAPVPEPAVLAFLALAGGLLLIRRQRRRRHA